MQKIIACERRSISCLCTELCLNACDVSCLQSVSACGEPQCCPLQDGCTLRITLPLAAQAGDSCGRCRALPASIEVDTKLPRSFICGMEDPRTRLLILPCVRLVRADGTGSGCFQVQLAVSLEIYLLRYETLCPCKPQCPQLPLYPQPMR